MTLNLHLPTTDELLKPTITVIGVGGAGGNAVNNMIASQLAGVGFVVANTDAQALEHSLSNNKVQLGGALTKGLGAGANPDIGRAATEEVVEEISRHIEGSNMVFITAGMGGGTGTGSAPVVARIARERGILTVAVVTKPFHFEGSHRMRLAEAGLKELQQYVDTLIVIPNQNLFRIVNERTTFADAFKLADEVLHSGVRGVTDLMVKPGLINLDFADIRAVMQEMGKAMMGTGEATGDRRAIEAAEAAISNPLLDDVSLKGAKSLLINITGGLDMTLFEVDEAANRVRQEVDPDANIIFGSAFSEDMQGRMRVSVVATGIDGGQQALDLQHAQQKAAEVKKPYMFSVQARPEPMKITPRTAQDVSTAASTSSAPRPSASLQTHATPAMSTSRHQIQRMDAPAQAEQPSAEEDAQAEAAALVMAKQIVAEQKQQKAEEAAAQLRQEPSRSEYPVARPIAAPTLSESSKPFTAADISPRAEQNEALEHKEMPSTRSLFQRISDVSKVLSSRPEPEHRDHRETRSEQREVKVAKEQPANVQAERSLNVKERKREKAKTPSLFDQEEQYIDIPAFLRRQAN
jgi:cell division protein FtsZ